MFGRSGQMFPRRAYHDAIYEEEYGSESGEVCCTKSSGFSSCLCWFLSVIILIGIAASVVLTVFFVLKSRNLMGKGMIESSSGELMDDLDLLYGFKRPKINTTQIQFDGSKNSLESTTASNFDPFSTTQSNENEFESEKRSNSNNNNSKLPQIVNPTRKIYNSPNRSTSTMATNPTTISTPIMKAQLPTMSTTIWTKDANKSSDPPLFHRNKNYELSTDLTNDGIERQIQKFKISENTHKMRLPNRFSSSESEENLSTTSHAHIIFSMPPTTNVQTNSEILNNFKMNMRRRPGPILKTYPSTTVQNSEEKDTTEESIRRYFQEENKKIRNLSNRDEILSKIIRNLQPKFTNNTQIFSSVEKFRPAHPNKKIKTTIRTRTTTTTVETPVLASSEEKNDANSENSEKNGLSLRKLLNQVQSPLDSKNEDIVKNEKNFQKNEKYLNNEFNENDNFKLVQSPVLSAKNSSSEFITVLVGNENEKNLNKETEDGLITSSILPPWYKNEKNEQIEHNRQNFNENQHEEFQINPILPASESNEEKEQNTNPGNKAQNLSEIENGYVSKSELSNSSEEEIDFSSSSNLPHSSNTDKNSSFSQFFFNLFQKNQDNDEKEKNGQNSEEGEEENSKSTTSFKDLLKELSPIFPTIPPKSEFSTEKPQANFTENSHFYTKNNNDFMSTTEKIPIFTNEELPLAEIGFVEESDEKLDDDEKYSPSHVIEVAYDSKNRPELIIEEDEIEREPLTAGSENFEQILAPPSTEPTKYFSINDKNKQTDKTQHTEHNGEYNDKNFEPIAGQSTEPTKFLNINEQNKQNEQNQYDEKYDSKNFEHILAAHSTQPTKFSNKNEQNNENVQNPYNDNNEHYHNTNFEHILAALSTEPTKIFNKNEDENYHHKNFEQHEINEKSSNESEENEEVKNYAQNTDLDKNDHAKYNKEILSENYNNAEDGSNKNLDKNNNDDINFQIELDKKRKNEELINQKIYNFNEDSQSHIEQNADFSHQHPQLTSSSNEKTNFAKPNEHNNDNKHTHKNTDYITPNPNENLNVNTKNTLEKLESSYGTHNVPRQPINQIVDSSYFTQPTFGTKTTKNFDLSTSTTTNSPILPTSSNGGNKFNPPEPMDFHSNVFSFKPSSASGGFQPVGIDNWTPVQNQNNRNQAFENDQDSSEQQAKITNIEQIRNQNLQKMRNNFEKSRLPVENSKISPPDGSFEESREKIGPVLVPRPSMKFPPNLDRTKYLHRPAPPPILMRRNPEINFPNRRQGGIPPYLQQQMRHQQVLKQRIFQQQLNKLRQSEMIKVNNNRGPQWAQ